MKRSLRTLSAACTALFLLSTAGAWKPSTHVYIAEQALRDALDGDGTVDINILQNGTAQNPPVIRQYAVDPDLLSALQNYPAQYRAGVIGPDGFPDIATGQEVIHPGPTTVAADAPAIDANRWLEHLWNSSRTESGPVKAFTAGFLTHAVEDMFGHTLIDYYTADKFNIDPPNNAIKHLVVEGYIGRRTPNILKFDRTPGSTDVNDYVTSNDTSIDGVKDFMYHQMIDAKPGTILNNDSLAGGLYNSGGGQYSVPLIFSKIRAGLQRDIDAYYQHKADLIQEAEDCSWYDFSCSSTAIYAELSWYMATNTVQVTYKEYWRADIDEGLAQWPDLSQNLSRDLLFPSTAVDLSQARMNTTDAKLVAKSYYLHHLLSMMGAPDVVGWSAALVDSVTSSVLDALQITYLRDLKAAAEEQLANWLVQKATNQSLDDWKLYAESPERTFDPVMSRGPGAQTSLQAFNNNVLHINDGQAVPDNGYTYTDRRFKISNLPAAYNSLTIAKMVLLSPSEFRRLMADLGGAPGGMALKDNAALGYIDSLDNNNQWSNNTADDRSPFRTCGIFLQLFERQLGGKLMEGGQCDAGFDGTSLPAPVVCGILPSGGVLAVSSSLYSCNRRFELRLQGDGNMVLYRNSVTPVWNTPTWGRAVDRLVMQGDGNLVIYGPSGNPVWSSNTWGHLSPSLVLQNDGNLVILDHATVVWSTGPH